MKQMKGNLVIACCELEFYKIMQTAEHSRLQLKTDCCWENLTVIIFGQSFGVLFYRINLDLLFYILLFILTKIDIS